ncbi:MAG: squalene/phytoene synthase family protein [Phenylobacterium sp.]|uniref:squalene/phytoene synthase family protein n=1 Tax=Phenylobacterium sp. TaxID=1871053 RepID=UPI001A46810E|nr:squalene/phytoene synthase family protein [Phenylobacterium sp.]MBL8556455.1 squalene/phytoene synthase family protein [Phenylobacterium sp.]
MSDDDLDDLIRRVDPDRWLSSRFIGDAGRRADVIAIYAYDHELARAPKVASNPLLGEIRLTWWREALDEIYEDRHVRHHPTAQALADVVKRHGLPREPLEAMIDARYRELDATPMSDEDAVAWARGTAGRAAEVAVRLLDPAANGAAALSAGAAWALDRKGLAKAGGGELGIARAAVAGLSAAAFPAVAHAALIGRAESEFRRRVALTWAVARGRI